MKALYIKLLLLALTLPMMVKAESDIRVFGGIGISSGNVRFYITSDTPAYSNRYHYYPPSHHYKHPLRGHRKGWHKRHWHHNYHSLPSHHWHRSHQRGYRSYYPTYQRIIIRDPVRHDYRRYRHHRSYRY